MDKIESSRIAELCDSYKAIASISMLAIAENDIEGVFSLNSSLKRMYKTLLKNAQDDDIKLIETYNKLLALEYEKLKTDDTNLKLKIIKLCLDFDYDEDLHKISLAQLFYKEGKYREAILLSEYLTTVCECAPPYLVLAKSYRALKMYDMSIKSYKKYLALNENDGEAKAERDETFEEMLGL